MGVCVCVCVCVLCGRLCVFVLCFSFIVSDNFKALRVLAEYKADFKWVEDDGRTALHQCAAWGKMAHVKCLVEECHIEINTKANDGHTPISDARRYGHHDIAQYLEQQIVLRVIMKHIDMFPFYKDVVTIIVQYLPYPPP